MLGVVLPAYNEEKRLPGALRAVRAAFPEALVVVADDGSSDRTAEVGESLGARVVRLRRNRGKGAAVREGILEALRLGCGPVLFSDCDLACPPGEWGRLTGVLERGADVAVASRWLRESRVEGRTLSRTLASWGFASLARILTGLPYRDFQCGCKAFAAGAARALFEEPLLCGRYAFDVELLLRARDLGLAVAEVPVFWRAGEESRVRVLKHGPEMLRSLLALRAAYGRRVSIEGVGARAPRGPARLRGASPA